MPYITTQCIVLHRTDYREADRILTLFSPDRGRMDAICRGCRKPKSPLLTAAELFTLGDYVLFTGRGRQMVHSCGVIETFYPLRLDYARLSHAAVLAGACLKVIQPEDPMSHLFILLARSLRRLAFEEICPEAVTAAFLLHFVSLQGFQPDLDHCARCGRALVDSGAVLLAQEDGACCLDCYKNAPQRAWLTSAQLSWLRAILTRGIDKAGLPPDSIPLQVLVDYAEYKLETRLPALPG
ncbi:MAG: DNA repair protein RecO [Christensenellales bacterium]